MNYLINSTTTEAGKLQPVGGVRHTHRLPAAPSTLWVSLEDWAHINQRPALHTHTDGSGDFGNCPTLPMGHAEVDLCFEKQRAAFYLCTWLRPRTKIPLTEGW